MMPEYLNNRTEVWRSQIYLYEFETYGFISNRLEIYNTTGVITAMSSVVSDPVTYCCEYWVNGNIFETYVSYHAG